MHKLKAAILGGAMAGIFSWAYALGDLTLDGVIKDYVSNIGDTTLLNSSIKTVKTTGGLVMRDTQAGSVDNIGDMESWGSWITNVSAIGTIHLTDTQIEQDVIVKHSGWTKWTDAFLTVDRTEIYLDSSRIEGTLNCISPCVIKKNYNSYIGAVKGNVDSQ